MSVAIRAIGNIRYSTRRSCAGRGTHRSVRRLEAAIWEFLDTSNAAGKPFVWTGRGVQKSAMKC